MELTFNCISKTYNRDISSKVLSLILNKNLNIIDGELFISHSSPYLDFVENPYSDAIHLIRLNDLQKWNLKQVSCDGYWSITPEQLSKISNFSLDDGFNDDISIGIDLVSGDVYFTDDLDLPFYRWQKTEISLNF